MDSSSKWFPLIQRVSQQWGRAITAVNPISQSERSCVLSITTADNQHYILKCGPRSNFGEQETGCLKRIFHPNIVNMIDHFYVEDILCLILEKIEGTSLINHLLSQGKVTDLEASYILYQVAVALNHLHKKGWIHRDVKADNIIFNPKTKFVKIIDFEFACEWSKWRKIHSKMGTLKYASPEVRRGKYSGPEIDVWSLGITLFTLVEGRFPYSDEELEAFQDKDIVLEFRNASEKCAQLIKKMLHQDGKKRITLEKVLTDDWILSHRKGPLRSIRVVPSAPQSLSLEDQLLNPDDILRTSASAHDLELLQTLEGLAVEVKNKQ